MTDKLTPDEIQRSHQWHAIECNNLAWTLADQPTRTEKETEDMLHAAHASAFHWSKVGTELHLARANMLLAHVHARLGDGKFALEYARQSFGYLLAHNPPDWEAAFAHAILAHAAFAAGEISLYKGYYAKAAELGEAIADLQDKEIFSLTFKTIPVPEG
jgi:hypothetical protein